MILVFLLSFHLFLIICYACLLELKISRLSFGYLFFALFFPFVGEVCLIAADLGKSPAENNFVKPFIEFEHSVKTDNLTKLESFDTSNISRTQILEIIREEPSNLVDLLKSALSSDDSEVVHIAAASIMKMQQNYENKIKLASESYYSMPQNMNRLKKYIETLGDYYSQGLLNGEAAVSLLEQQATLLEKYLNVLPEDKEMGMLYIKNSLQQNKYELAIQQAQFVRYSFITDFDIWELSVQVLNRSGNQTELKKLFEEGIKLSNHWSYSDRAKWDSMQKELCI